MVQVIGQYLTSNSKNSVVWTDNSLVSHHSYATLKRTHPINYNVAYTATLVVE